MTDYLQNLADVVWALRWVITFAVIIIMILFIAHLIGERDDARAEARGLYMENADLRARLRDQTGQAPTRRRRPIIAGRVIS